jgi:hypothetical protein
MRLAIASRIPASFCGNTFNGVVVGIDALVDADEDVEVEVDDASDPDLLHAAAAPTATSARKSRRAIVRLRMRPTYPS